MDLAKPHIDVGLCTNRRDAQLRFWGDEAGLAYDHVLRLGHGFQQHRFATNGSVVKVNDSRDPLPESAPAGFCTLLIAADVAGCRVLSDPDGNVVSLVPRGYEGINGIAVRVLVTDVAASRRFYSEALGMVPATQNALRCGDSLLFIAPSPAPVRAGDMMAIGFRYLTIQVHDCDAEHALALRRGAIEGRAPTTLGTTARISFVRDSDGNWIEISQRASLTGAPVAP
jgi:catechol 2,3-dioxygenase-like lactoylglutathione lyase family enzyme